MARRTSPPFRADHVGSLLRPQRLLQAREDFAAGRISARTGCRIFADTFAPRLARGAGRQSALSGKVETSLASAAMPRVGGGHC